MKRRLTHKQREYAKRRAAGDSYADAYIGAGYSGNAGKDTAKHNAYKLEHNTGETSTHILATIEKLRRQAEQGAILDRQSRQAALSNIAMDVEESTTDRLRAFDQLARMSGDYNDKVSHTVEASVSYGDKLQAIRDAIEGK